MRDVNAAASTRCKAAGAWVFAGGLHPPSTATVVRRRSDGDVLTTDGPFAEGKEHIGGFIDHQGAGSRRRARVGPQAARAATDACRSRCGRSRRTSADRRVPDRRQPRRSNVSSARSTAARWPSWSAYFGDIDLAEEAVQDAFTVALQRWPATGLPPSPAGWIITTARNRAIDRLRREASREDRHAQAALLHAPATSLHETRTPCSTIGCA